MNTSDDSWKTAWQKWWNPVEIGEHLVVYDANKPSPHSDRRIQLALQVGLTFGAGTHETTQLCWELIEHVYAQRNPKTMIDVGCGTGLLVLASERLGFEDCWGIDISPEAVETARLNAQRNNCARSKVFDTLVADISRSFDVVCSNMISSILLEHWTDIRSLLRQNGSHIISGLLIDELDDFIGKTNLSPLRVSTKGQWAALLA